MPPICIVTGSAGLVGSEAVRFFARQGFKVVGFDNDMRAEFFGPEASTSESRRALIADVPNYVHRCIDIRSQTAVNDIFELFREQITVVIHTAAQPSHDWAAGNPQLDFAVNANGTLNLLEATRRYCPDATFVLCSTNKVYGDGPNRAVLIEKPTRFEVLGSYGFQEGYNDSGFNEGLSIDQCTHSLFGASKLAADILAQEYGRYFGLKTGVFRGGCLTGPAHAGAKQHGFLAYLVKCAVAEQPYEIIGYQGKQVRDNIHAADLIAAFWEFTKSPRAGEVYNIGGGRSRSCSVLEAIELVDRLAGTQVQYSCTDTPRVGDHRWWITDTSKFERDYPEWKQQYTLEETIGEIVEAQSTVGVG